MMLKMVKSLSHFLHSKWPVNKKVNIWKTWLSQFHFNKLIKSWWYNLSNLCNWKKNILSWGCGGKISKRKRGFKRTLSLLILGFVVCWLKMQSPPHFLGELLNSEGSSHYVFRTTFRNEKSCALISTHRELSGRIRQTRFFLCTSADPYL